MKKRNGFVSNSSSSSFICEICNDVIASGYDIDYETYEICECENYHSFCECHIETPSPDRYIVILESLIQEKREHLNNITPENDYEWRNQSRYKNKIKSLQEELDEFKSLSDEEKEMYLDEEISDVLSELRYEIPAQFCPVCTMEGISDKLLLEHIQLEYNLDFSQIKEDLKNKYKTLQFFKNSLKNDE